jgi:hypothetical protein
MITALSKDGKHSREVLYNEIVLMLDKYDSLSFDVKNKKFVMDMKFNFSFSDSGDKYSADGALSDDGKEVNLTLNNWYSPFRAENTNAIEFDLKSGHKILVKYGTSADEKQPFRMFHLTIWGEFKL